MKTLLFLLLTLSQFSYAQTQLDFSAVKINKPNIGEELLISKTDGTNLADGQYLIQDEYKALKFDIKNNHFESSIKFIKASNNRLSVELFTENNIIIEINEYVNYADESKNTGPPILSEKKVLKDDVYCEIVFDKKGNKTYKRCTKGDDNHSDDDYNDDDDDLEIYLFQCSTKTIEPENKYCEEFDYINKITKFYKNYELFKEVLLLNDSTENYYKTINYSDSNLVIDEIYEYPDSIKTVKADKSYTIEIKEDSRTSATKVSYFTAYDKNGNKVFTEKREKERSFDGITTVKRIQKDKIIIERYDNNLILIDSKEE